MKLITWLPFKTERGVRGSKQEGKFHKHGSWTLSQACHGLIYLLFLRNFRQVVDGIYVSFRELCYWERLLIMGKFSRKWN